MLPDSGDALDFTDMTTTAPNHRVDVLPTAVLLIVVALPVVAAAQDKVLGLLVLPEAFGYGPCQQFEPAAIELYDAPSAVAPIGTIQVDQHWSFAPHGGCDGLKVRVHSRGVRAELPTLEYSNESPAAIVLAAQDGWFKVRLAAGAAWLRASRHDRFISMADLFSEHPTLTALTEAHTGPLRETPGAAAPASQRSGFRRAAAEGNNMSFELDEGIAVLERAPATFRAPSPSPSRVTKSNDVVRRGPTARR